jgi:O-antigen/teichoic acid export membrane protein
VTDTAASLWGGTVARARALLRNRAVRGFSHVLTGNMLVTLSQALQFLLLARVLGPDEFGKIAAVASVATVLTPFSGMGAANVMIMRASREPTLLRLYFGNALINAVVTGTLLTVFATVVITPFLGAKAAVAIMLVFCASELIFNKIIDICWQVFVSSERLHWTSIFLVMQSATKLAAVFLFVALSAHRAAVWAWWALGSNLAVASWTVIMTSRTVGRPQLDWQLAKREFTKGVPFAVGLSAKGFYTDADKVFLARYGAAQSVGMYTVAFRVVQMALAPIKALSTATQARYYRAGEAGVRGSVGVAWRLARGVIPMAALMGVGFYVCAPLITWLTGDQYTESVRILRWFAAMPVLLAAQSLLADALAGGGYQHLAAAMQVAAAVLTCALCVVLIPRLDWIGAVLATYISQSFLLVALATALRRVSKPA